VSADFNWWLILVGVVIGAALTWLVVAESQRREREVGERELEAEAGWIARTIDAPGVDAERAELVLRAHRRYLKFPPPDTLVDPAALRELDTDAAERAAEAPASWAAGDGAGAPGAGAVTDRVLPDPHAVAAPDERRA